ncbi:MAG: hypothetical protein AAGA30_22015, partial [Planctomycetota bacterium]
MRKTATLTLAALFFLTGSDYTIQGQENFPWRASGDSGSATEAFVDSNASIFVQAPDQIQTQIQAPSQKSLGETTGNSGINTMSVSNPVSPPAGRPIPSPPNTKAPSIFASLKSRIQDGAAEATQPSLSDVNEYSFDSVPAPGPIPQNAANSTTTDQVYQGVVSPTEPLSPPVSVQSNAATDDPNYCQRDCRRGSCELGCIKRIFGTSPNGLEVGGWAQFGYHNRDTILFNDRRGNFAPHQIWFYAGNEAER